MAGYVSGSVRRAGERCHVGRTVSAAEGQLPSRRADECLPPACESGRDNTSHRTPLTSTDKSESLGFKPGRRHFPAMEKKYIRMRFFNISELYINYIVKYLCCIQEWRHDTAVRLCTHTLMRIICMCVYLNIYTCMYISIYIN